DNLPDHAAEPPDDDGPQLTLERRGEYEISQLLASVSQSPFSSARPLEFDDLRYRAELTPRGRRSLRTYRRQFIDLELQPLDVVAARLHHFLPALLVDRPLLWPLQLANLVERIAEMPLNDIPIFLRRAEAQSTGLQNTIASELLLLAAQQPTLFED